MRKIIIAAVIIFFVIVGIIGSMDEIETNKKRNVTSKPKIATATKRPTKKPKKQDNVLIDGFQKRPVINGMGDKVIGKYGYIKLIKSNFKLLCTDKVLIDFVNFLNKQNLLYVIIDFDDGTGLHGIKSLWTYCNIDKDKNGIFEAGKYLGDLKIYTDSKKVDRSNLEF